MKRVLLIDDEVDLLEILADNISYIEENLEINKATNIPDAIELISKADFHLIISDINLGPNCVTELINWLNESKHTPFLCVMSGFIPEAADFKYPKPIYKLQKPFDDDEIEKVINLLS